MNGKILKFKCRRCGEMEVILTKEEAKKLDTKTLMSREKMLEIAKEIKTDQECFACIEYKTKACPDYLKNITKN